MNRRDFAKLVIAAGASAVLPENAKATVDCVTNVTVEYFSFFKADGASEFKWELRYKVDDGEYQDLSGTSLVPEIHVPHLSIVWDGKSVGPHVIADCSRLQVGHFAV